MRSTSSMGLPQVGGDHVRLSHHRADDVLDEDDGRSLRSDRADEADCVVDLGVSEAGEYFVEQEQARARSERAGELEEFSLVQVELARERRRFRAETGVREPAARLALRLRAGERIA